MCPRWLPIRKEYLIPLPERDAASLHLHPEVRGRGPLDTAEQAWWFADLVGQAFLGDDEQPHRRLFVMCGLYDIRQLGRLYYSLIPATLQVPDRSLSLSITPHVKKVPGLGDIYRGRIDGWIACASRDIYHSGAYGKSWAGLDWTRYGSAMQKSSSSSRQSEALTA